MMQGCRDIKYEYHITRCDPNAMSHPCSRKRVCEPPVASLVSDFFTSTGFNYPIDSE